MALLAQIESTRTKGGTDGTMVISAQRKTWNKQYRDKFYKLIRSIDEGVGL
jgi:hypothetical protein